MNVSVLCITHRYGTNVYACKDETVAYKELVEYVREQWGDELPNKPEPIEDDEAVDSYFETLAGVPEYYEIVTVPLIES